MSDKAVKLSHDEQKLLDAVTVDQLKFFSDIARNKDFPKLTALINKMIDKEKNQFFSQNEYDTNKLALDHAYARGGVGMLVSFARMIAASPHELEKRGKGD